LGDLGADDRDVEASSQGALDQRIAVFQWGGHAHEGFA
jgi:hypothetical protein